MGRTILHSDLNHFYAAVECLKNPKIRYKPVVVCGDVEKRHGIILTKNPIAKQFGITTGEPIWQAKQKCPELIAVQANFSEYLRFSKCVKEIYAEYTDQIESFGIDEAWMDVTGSISLFGDGEKIANEIRKRVFYELGLTVSIGVSYNKIFAKLGSDMRKPDATTVITKDSFKQTVWRLPASDLLYVGRATAKKLSTLSIKSIGDLAKYDSKYLYSWLGKWGVVLQRFANGEDNSPVSSNGGEAVIKSVGNSITAPRDLRSIEDVKSIFFMLSESVAARLREQGLKCTTVQISIRDKNLISCERQAKLKYPTFLSGEIAEKALDIFITKHQFTSTLRSIGVRGTDLVDMNTNQQLDLFTDFSKRDRLEKLEQTIDEIRNRFGYHAIQKGILLVDRNLTGISPKDDHVIHPKNYFDGAIL